MGRKDVLDSIDEYVKGGDRRPMVVHGASGSGKSALMARASEALLGKPGDAVVIRRFIGVTPESSSGITLLRSLCEEFGRRYGVTEEIPVEFHSVARTFASRLALATADRPLVLFIDALDQIAASDAAADISWLMPELPRHCRVLLSTTDVARSLEAARPVELGALPADDAEEALALWLHDASYKKIARTPRTLYRAEGGEQRQRPAIDRSPRSHNGHRSCDDRVAVSAIIRSRPEMLHVRPASQPCRKLTHPNGQFAAESRGRLSDRELQTTD
jgi:hypothetical protein